MTGPPSVTDRSPPEDPNVAATVARGGKTWGETYPQLSFWMLTRGSPGHGVLHTDCEEPLRRSFPR